MNAPNRADRRSTISDRSQDLDLFFRRCCRRGEQKGGGAAASMIIANCAESFDGAVHGVAAERAVNVKINKTRCEIISVKVDDIFATRSCLLTNVGNFSLLHDNFQAIANSIGKNQTRVCEGHHLEPSTLNVQGGFARSLA